MDNEPDINWREDFLNTKERLNKRTIELLKNGPTNFSQALILKELKVRWLKMKGLYKRAPDPPDCQSSFKDFNMRVETEKYL